MEKQTFRLSKIEITYTNGEKGPVPVYALTFYPTNSSGSLVMGGVSKEDAETMEIGKDYELVLGESIVA